MEGRLFFILLSCLYRRLNKGRWRGCNHTLQEFWQTLIRGQHASHRERAFQIRKQDPGCQEASLLNSATSLLSGFVCRLMTEIHDFNKTDWPLLPVSHLLALPPPHSTAPDIFAGFNDVRRCSYLPIHLLKPQLHGLLPPIRVVVHYAELWLSHGAPKGWLDQIRHLVWWGW